MRATKIRPKPGFQHSQAHKTTPLVTLPLRSTSSSRSGRRRRRRRFEVVAVVVVVVVVVVVIIIIVVVTAVVRIVGAPQALRFTQRR